VRAVMSTLLAMLAVIATLEAVAAPMAASVGSTAWWDDLDRETAAATPAP
jgi:hypothetical protein